MDDFELQHQKQTTDILYMHYNGGFEVPWKLYKAEVLEDNGDYDAI